LPISVVFYGFQILNSNDYGPILVIVVILIYLMFKVLTEELL
jgi:hypothetical protein